MDWNEILNKRSQIYTWDDRVPDRSVIEDIINEIHHYCPSKQRKVPYYIDVIRNVDYNYNQKFYNFILDNKSNIQDAVTAWIKQQIENKSFESHFYDELKCRRDIGFIISGLANDIKYNTNKYTCAMIAGYFKDGKPQIRQKIEVLVHLFLKSVLLKLAEDNNLEPEFISIINDRTNIIIDVIENGPKKIPEITQGIHNLMFDIFYGTATQKENLNFADDRRNPQILAPWLLVFSNRFLDGIEVGNNIEMKTLEFSKLVSYNEIGLAAMFAVLSATNKGLDTSFCGCIQNQLEISIRLGHRIDEHPILYVGIGYKSPETKHFNPITHEYYDNFDKNDDQKPSKDLYIKYHT